MTLVAIVEGAVHKGEDKRRCIAVYGREVRAQPLLLQIGLVV